MMENNRTRMDADGRGLKRGIEFGANGRVVSNVACCGNERYAGIIDEKTGIIIPFGADDERAFFWRRSLGYEITGFCNYENVAGGENDSE